MQLVADWVPPFRFSTPQILPYSPFTSPLTLQIIHLVYRQIIRLVYFQIICLVYFQIIRVVYIQIIRVVYIQIIRRDSHAKIDGIIPGHSD